MYYLSYGVCVCVFYISDCIFCIWFPCLVLMKLNVAIRRRVYKHTHNDARASSQLKFTSLLLSAIWYKLFSVLNCSQIDFVCR